MKSEDCQMAKEIFPEMELYNNILYTNILEKEVLSKVVTER